MSSIRWHPYVETFPMLEGEEYEALKRSIQERGDVIYPILYRVPNPDPTKPIDDEEREYLDGRNRMRACKELGIWPEEQRVLVADDQVQQFIDACNERRRHMTPEQRRERVRLLTEAGLSSRAIAQKLGTTHTTVQKDQHKLKSGQEAPSGGNQFPPGSAQEPETRDQEAPASTSTPESVDGVVPAATADLLVPPAVAGQGARSRWQGVPGAQAEEAAVAQRQGATSPARARAG